MNASPKNLLNLQRWFASIITRPIDRESRMLPTSPSGRPMAEEAAELIAPSPSLSPDKRIQIYNQQYWWRLLSILQTSFPLLTRLFGYADFNRLIGMPYLSKYPSLHWSLSKLGNTLPQWIEEEYEAIDKPLVHFSAELDWAYQEVFFAPPAISLPFSLEILSKKLSLQPHMKLFQLPFDLFTFRRGLLEETVDYWMDHDFPELPKKKVFFALYRTKENKIVFQELQEGQWQLLSWISEGMSIEEACEKLESRGGPSYADACLALSEWIQEWIIHCWIMNMNNLF